MKALRLKCPGPEGAPVRAPSKSKDLAEPNLPSGFLTEVEGASPMLDRTDARYVIKALPDSGKHVTVSAIPSGPPGVQTRARHGTRIQMIPEPTASRDPST